MNVKKMIFSVIAAATTALAVGSISAAAYTIVHDDYLYTTANVKTAEYKYVGNYANHYAKIQDTAISSTNASYNGSYKYVYYKQYGERNGSFYTICSTSEKGLKPTILTDPIPVDNYVAGRHHDTELHYTSDAQSSVKEEFSATIIKP